MDKTINFNPTDWDSVLKIMDEYGNANDMMSGTNEDGEDVWLSPFPDRIVTKTFQANGWTRINTYWRDGTREETFKRERDESDDPSRYDYEAERYEVTVRKFNSKVMKPGKEEIHKFDTLERAVRYAKVAKSTYEGSDVIIRQISRVSNW